MDCNRSSQLISLSIDQMLSEVEQLELEKHLATCEECKEEYEMFQSIQSALNSEEAASLPDDFHSHLMTRIEEEKVSTSEESNVVPLRKPIYKRFSYKQFNVAAAIIIVVIFGIIGVSNLDTFYQSANESAVQMDASTYESEEAIPVEMKTESKVDRSLMLTADKEATGTSPDMAEKSVVTKEAKMDVANEVVEDLAETTMEIATMDEVAEEADHSEEVSSFTVAPEQALEKDNDMAVTESVEQAVVVQYSDTNDDQASNSSEMQREDEGSEKLLKSAEEPHNEVPVQEVSNLPTILLSIIAGFFSILGIGLLIYRKHR